MTSYISDNDIFKMSPVSPRTRPSSVTSHISPRSSSDTDPIKIEYTKNYCDCCDYD